MPQSELSEYMQNYRKYREKERSGSSETIHRYREEYHNQTVCAVIDKDSIAQISSKIKNIPDSDLVKSANSGHPMTSSDKSSSAKPEKKDAQSDDQVYFGEYDTEQDTDELGATYTTNSQNNSYEN